MYIFFRGPVSLDPVFTLFKYDYVSTNQGRGEDGGVGGNDTSNTISLAKRKDRQI